MLSCTPILASLLPFLPQDDGGAPPVADPAPVEESRPLQDDALEGWLSRIERDARASFPRKNDTALDLMQVGRHPRDEEERGAALMALGAGGDGIHGGLLESWASEGSGSVRLAALLAMGELGEELGERESFLVDLLRSEDAEVRECALLALLRTGGLGWQDQARGIATDPEHPLYADAPRLLAFVEDPAAAFPPHRATLRLFDVRWRAATLFGRVDGRGFSANHIVRLAEDELFLEEMVLQASSDIHGHGLEDHLLSLLLKPGHPARVRTVVRVMPDKLEQIVVGGFWEPSNPEEWRQLVDEAMRTSATKMMRGTLEKATADATVGPAAAVFLLRLNPVWEDLVLSGLNAADPEQRIFTCRAIGAAGLSRYLGALTEREGDEHPKVRAAALAARMVIGDARAYDVAEEMLTGGSDEARTDLIDAVADAGVSGDLTAFLHAVAEEEEGLLRADLFATCALRGRLVEGSALREAFPLCPPGSTTSLRLIEALSILPSAADLEFLADQFPTDRPHSLNVTLAGALIRGAHKKVEPLLRSAVWNSDLHVSLLAGGVTGEAFGLRTLEHWVLRPPTGASAADVRRVGYAIGQWGGVAAIDSLRERMGGGAGADRPALQGAYLGAMAARTH